MQNSDYLFHHRQNDAQVLCNHRVRFTFGISGRVLAVGCFGHESLKPGHFESLQPNLRVDCFGLLYVESVGGS